MLLKAIKCLRDFYTNSFEKYNSQLSWKKQKPGLLKCIFCLTQCSTRNEPFWTYFHFFHIFFFRERLPEHSTRPLYLRYFDNRLLKKEFAILLTCLSSHGKLHLSLLNESIPPYQDNFIDHNFYQRFI